MEKAPTVCARYNSFVANSRKKFLEYKEDEEFNPMDYVLAFKKERTYHFQITVGGPNIWIYFFVSEGEASPYRGIYYSTEGWKKEEYHLNEEEIEEMTDLFNLNFEE